MAEDSNKCHTGEGLSSGGTKTEEGCRQSTILEERAEVGNWALGATNEGCNHLGTKVEWVGLGGWQGDDSMV